MDTFATDTGPYAFYETARSPVRMMSKVTAAALHEGTITHDLHGRSGEARLSYAVESSGSATIDICQGKCGFWRHAHALAEELDKPVCGSPNQSSRTSGCGHAIRHESPGWSSWRITRSRYCCFEMKALSNICSLRVS